MSDTESIKFISDFSRICRTCLSEKNLEDLCCVFDNSLDVILANLAEINVIIYKVKQRIYMNYFR